MLLSSGRGLSLSSGGQTLGLDMRHLDDGTVSVVLGMPFNCEIRVGSHMGRRRFCIEAPTATKIAKGVA